MKREFSVLAASILIVSSLSASASYKEAFTQSASDPGVQVLLGFGDIVAAVFNGVFIDVVNGKYTSVAQARPDLSQALAQAQEDLEGVKALMTHADRQKLIRDMLAEVEKSKASPNYDSLMARVQKDIADIESRPVSTPSEKALALRTAKIKLTTVRHNNISEALKVGKAGMIRNVVIAGEALFILDIAQRVYVFNSLDKSPTLSPSLTAIAHILFP